MPKIKPASVLYSPFYELSRFDTENSLIMWAGHTYNKTKHHDVVRDFYSGIDILLKMLKYNERKFAVAILRQDRSKNNRSVALVLFYANGNIVKVWELPYEKRLANLFLNSQKYTMRNTRDYLKKWVDKIGYEEGRAKLKSNGANLILKRDSFRPFTNDEIAIQLRNTDNIWHNIFKENVC